MTALTGVFKNFYSDASPNNFQVQISTQIIKFPSNFPPPPSGKALTFKKWPLPVDKYCMWLGYEACILPDWIHICTHFLAQHMHE